MRMTTNNKAEKMNYEIIFYHSGKTAETERLIEKKMGGFKLERSKTTAATDPEELVSNLNNALKRTELIFICGGLDGSRQSTDSVLSAVLSAGSGKLISEKLIDDKDNIAYIIRAERQLIIAVPDDPEVISGMSDKRIRDELQAIYSLEPDEDEKPSIDEITQKLDEQLKAASSSRIQPINKVALQQEQEQKKLLFASVILGVASAALAISAILLYVL